MYFPFIDHHEVIIIIILQLTHSKYTDKVTSSCCYNNILKLNFIIISNKRNRTKIITKCTSATLGMFVKERHDHIVMQNEVQNFMIVWDMEAQTCLWFITCLSEFPDFLCTSWPFQQCTLPWVVQEVQHPAAHTPLLSH